MLCPDWLDRWQRARHRADGPRNRKIKRRRDACRGPFGHVNSVARVDQIVPIHAVFNPLLRQLEPRKQVDLGLLCNNSKPRCSRTVWRTKAESLSEKLSPACMKMKLDRCYAAIRAGEGNRTLVFSLEVRCFHQVLQWFFRQIEAKTPHRSQRQFCAVGTPLRLLLLAVMAAHSAPRRPPRLLRIVEEDGHCSSELDRVITTSDRDCTLSFIPNIMTAKLKNAQNGISTLVRSSQRAPFRSRPSLRSVRR
jgi:hypothetical protein